MEKILQCRKFEVVRHHIATHDGGSESREYIIHPGAVVVLPLLDAEHCVMIRQFRPAIGRDLIELPAGTLDVPGEKREQAALRELREETGLKAARLKWLVDFYPSPGILSERISTYVAADLQQSAPSPEPTELIEPMQVTLTEAIEMIHDGRIMDGKTIITLLRWEQMGRPIP